MPENALCAMVWQYKWNDSQDSTEVMAQLGGYPLCSWARSSGNSRGMRELLIVALKYKVYNYLISLLRSPKTAGWGSKRIETTLFILSGRLLSHIPGQVPPSRR